MTENKGKLKLLIKVAILVAAFLVYCLFNIRVDSGHILSAANEDSDEMAAVGIIMSGKNAEGLENYDERLVKRTLINRGKTSDCIVLGSSRAALIMSDYVESGDLLNLSVTGACLQDIIGIYDAYIERNGVPDRIIISVDPWLLNDSYVDSRFARSLGDSYYRYTSGKLGYGGQDKSLQNVRPMYRTGESGTLFDLNLAEIRELLSIPYFQSNLRFCFSDKTAASVFATKEDFDVYGVLRSDGSYGYPFEYRYSDEAALLERTNSQIAVADGSRIVGFKGYDTCTGGNYQLFEDFLGEMKESGVEVNILMTPLSPILWDFMEQNHPGCSMLKAGDAVSHICADTGTLCYGSFDPHELGYGYHDFYDGYHLRAENIETMIAEMEDIR